VTELFIAGDGVAGAEARDRELVSLRRVETHAASRGVPITHVGDDVIAALSDTTTPQGIVAVVAIDEVSIADMARTADLILVLAEVRDPGNAGTLLRSALGAGAGGVVLSRGTVDAWTSKTVRASAGALFKVPIKSGSPVEEALRELRSAGFSLVGTDAGARRAPEEVDLTGRVAVVVGNESWGMPPSAAGLVDIAVGIPMPGPAESLNAGIAGSILLFEAVRQRRVSGVYSLAPND
jgi:RNA methyltransferase, TrmH family